MKTGLFFITIVLLYVGCKPKGVKNNKAEEENKNIEASYLPAGFITTEGTIITYPIAKGYVNDFAHVLTQAEKNLLDSILTTHEKNTTNEIAIIIFDTIPITKQEFNDFTLRLANKWGIGKNETNNGIAICLCIKMQKIRIQNGRGIEKILSDSATLNIIDSLMLPQFKKQQYYTAIKNGLKEIISVTTVAKRKNDF